MGDARTTADGGQPGGTEWIEAIAAEIEALGSLIREQAADGAAGGDVELPDEAAPSLREFDDHDAYLRAAHAWVFDECLDAASDLEHRTLELQQAVELYPGPWTASSGPARGSRGSRRRTTGREPTATSDDRGRVPVEASGGRRP